MEKRMVESERSHKHVETRSALIAKMIDDKTDKGEGGAKQETKEAVKDFNTKMVKRPEI